MGLAEQIVASLPQGSKDQAIARSARCRDLILSGQALELRFVPIVSTLSEQGIPRWVATFHVTTDAIQIGLPGDSFRPTLTDQDQIRVADALGLSRTTGRLADLAYAAAPLKLAPVLKSATDAEVAIMGTAPVMLAHSKAVDAQIAAGAPGMTWDPTFLRRPVGKDWCASNGNTTSGGSRHATNYGWHTARRTGYEPVTSLPGVHVEQPFAHKHWWTHTDYSQVATFVDPSVQLLDLRTAAMVETNLRDLNADPMLAQLWSHEGTIREALPERSRLASIGWIAYGAIGAIAIGALAAALAKGT